MFIVLKNTTTILYKLYLTITFNVKPSLSCLKYNTMHLRDLQKEVQVGSEIRESVEGVYIFKKEEKFR